ncbi:MAG: hypothetical protein JRH20_03880 [Deltaproteobacteria bacterium]|nr:hypothetical protein [Deltaproteobacteria bacterium]
MRDVLDEPGITLQRAPSATPDTDAPDTDAPAFWVRLGAGMSSLVVDPDINTGVAATLALGMRIYRRFSVEAQLAAAYNPFGGDLGEAGHVAFGGGSLSLAPQIELTRPGAAFAVILDTGIGFYYTAPMLQEGSWSLGFSAGMGLEWRIFHWLALGVRARYHLFNITRISGPELIDVKSVQQIGIVDRLEIPGYVALTF